MIDWNLVAKIAGGGYGMAIFVLITVSLLVWIVGLLIQRYQVNGKEDSSKG